MKLKAKKSHHVFLKNRSALEEVEKEKKVGKYARIDESLNTRFENKLFKERLPYVDWLTQRIIEYVNK